MPYTDEQATILIAEAFKRFLREQLGPIEDKPIVELMAWDIALLSMARDMRIQQAKISERSP